MATVTTTLCAPANHGPRYRHAATNTLDQLRGLRLDGMIAALADTGTQAAAEQLPFDQRLALLVQRELDWRDGRRGATAEGRSSGQQRLRRRHRLACRRGLDRHLITALAGGDWIRHGRTS